MGNKYDPANLFLETYVCDIWFENKRSDDTTKSDAESTNSPPVPALEGGEEVKEGKRLKILTPKTLIRIPVLLVQIKAGNNSFKLKNEIRRIPYLLYQHNKTTKKLDNNLIKSL